jgi:hypothetical protein
MDHAFQINTVEEKVRAVCVKPSSSSRSSPKIKTRQIPFVWFVGLLYRKMYIGERGFVLRVSGKTPEKKKAKKFSSFSSSARSAPSVV